MLLATIHGGTPIHDNGVVNSLNWLASESFTDFIINCLMATRLITDTKLKGRCFNIFVGTKTGMKTIFIVNPKAGKGKKAEKLIAEIKTLIHKKPDEVDWYLTKGVGDATRFVKEYCATYGVARFIACGGDGTFSEVVNGIADFPEAEVGVVPIGTGNDFCRNFPKETAFYDLVLQITSQTTVCDVIRYTTWVDGIQKEGICANMFNIGFDCNVADKVSDIKEKTIFGGSIAYFVSILWNLIQKKSTNLRVELDGVVKHDGELLLTSIANGNYCGGGIMSNPLASVTDGKINVNMIKNISRLRFISLLPFYMQGTHMGLKGITEIITCGFCKSLTVTPKAGTVRLCIDGEIITAGKTTFQIVHGGMRFVVPGMKAFSQGAATEEMVLEKILQNT